MNVLSKIFVLVLLIVSCSEKEQFASSTRGEESEAQSFEILEESLCNIPGSSTPPVDILFVVDNSSSINYIRNQISQEISNLVLSISQSFNNYNALIVPLIPEPGENNLTSFPLLTDSTDNLDPSYWVHIQSASNFQLTNNPVVTAQEEGFNRVINVINANMSDDSTNRVFRKNAYTVVVLITNGSDSTVTQYGAGGTTINQAALNGYIEQLKQFHAAHPASQLNSLQFRFVSIVPHENSCRPDPSRRSFGYISASANLYQYNKSNPAGDFAAVSDQDDRDKKDSYNLCAPNLSESFARIRTTIESMRIGHSYDHWPVQIASHPNQIDFDPALIKVFKGYTGSQNQLQGEVEIFANSSNGFQYIGFQQNQNLRYDPAPNSTLLPNEQETGFFIKLFGDARVTFPECMKVKRQAPAQWFGYFTLTKDPRPETIVVTKNGEVVPQSNTNGWSFNGEFAQSKNIQIISPDDKSPGEPGKFKTGYLIEFHGDAIYNNEDFIQVRYKAKPI